MSLRLTLPLVITVVTGCAWSDRVEGWLIADDGDTQGEEVGGGNGLGGDAPLGGTPSAGGESSDGGAGGAVEVGPVCGDAVIDLGETCDDGNTITGDGCAACQIECGAMEMQDPLTGHCYALFTTASNQPNAEANCQAWGGAPGLGHLVMFENQAENDFVAPLANADTWIGADDFGGAFAWIDGTPFSFTNWQQGEPNHPGIEHCMFMDADAKWHDHNCGDATRPAYLCERGAAAP